MCLKAQGSVVGPILFLIYANHIVSNLSCSYMLFADDIKLFISFNITQHSYSVTDLQRNLDILVSTSESWGLSLNPAKCVCLRFGAHYSPLYNSGISPYRVHDTHLKFSPTHSDLGIAIDIDLKFHVHITNKVNIANALTTNIFSCTLCRDKSFLLNIYRSIIRPQLEYGSPLWNVGYMCDIRQLERVQKRWTKAIVGMENLPYHERLRQLDLFSFRGRLLRADLILVWKIFNGKCGIKPDDLFVPVGDSQTRGHPLKIFVPRCNLDIRLRFFSLRTIRTWNSLSRSTVMSSSLSSFKASLYLDLGQLLFDYID